MRHVERSGTVSKSISRETGGIIRAPAGDHLSQSQNCGGRSSQALSRVTDPNPPPTVVLLRAVG
eukprot:scaffold9957_cov44-Phaeocystis_antarctica.AAC.2